MTTTPAGVTLDLEAATAIGKGYGTIISRNGGTKVVVGNEERPFGKELKDALVAGIISTGISVIDLGVVLTPMVYFLNAYLKTDGGINITGSHNIYFYKSRVGIGVACRRFYQTSGLCVAVFLVSHFYAICSYYIF